MKLGRWIGSNVYNMHAEFLGRYIEGQGHSMQQNQVRPTTELFEVWLYNYFTEMLTTLRWVASNIWVATLKVNVTAGP